LESEENKNGVLAVCRKHVVWLPDGTEYDLNLPNTGWVKQDSQARELCDGVTWSTRVDISLGPSLNAEIVDDGWFGKHLLKLSKKVTPFDVMNKVGMVVYSLHGADKDALVDEHDLDDLDDAGTGIRGIYGEAKDIMVYTGKITYVGETHLEYNINGIARLLWSNYDFAEQKPAVSRPTQ
jgi:hypothetical protein